MSNVPHDLPYDNRLLRMRKRLQGLQRVAAAINDLYLWCLSFQLSKLNYGVGAGQRTIPKDN